MSAVAVVLPESVIDAIVQLKGGGDDEYFGIGAIALEVEGPTRQGYKMTARQKALRNALLTWCGCGEKELVERKQCAQFYPEETQKRYRQVLTRYYFKIARRSGTLEKAIHWLDLCVTSADEYGGTIMPVRVLAAKVRKARQKEVGEVAAILEVDVPRTLAFVGTLAASVARKPLDELPPEAAKITYGSADIAIAELERVQAQVMPNRLNGSEAPRSFVEADLLMQSAQKSLDLCMEIVGTTTAAYQVQVVLSELVHAREEVAALERET